MRPTFVMKHFVRNAAAKGKFLYEGYLYNSRQRSIFINEIYFPKPKMTDSKFTKFKYLILQVVRNQTIFIFKLFLFMATIFSVILK